MTREEIYVEKMCKYCKGNCDKGIVVFNNESTIYTKCVDYEPKGEVKRNKLLENWKIEK